MGTPGKPIVFDKLKIVEYIKKQRGRLTLVCKDAGCCYVTLQKYIEQHPDLKEIIEHQRNFGHEELIDKCENKLLSHIEDNEDKNISLKSIMFTLNSIGHKRGWINSYKPQDNVQGQEQLGFRAAEAARKAESASEINPEA